MKQVEADGKEFFALPMERKMRVRSSDVVNFFGYTAGSPIKWKSKWWLEGLQLKVHIYNASLLLCSELTGANCHVV